MKRNIALDALKLTMALMVVGLHAGFLADVTSLGNYLTVDGIFRIAVPVFLIINGFYFYPVLANNRQVDWLKRVLTLYVVWMTLYAYFWFYVPELSASGIIKFIQKIAIGYHHLWYIAGMIGAGVMLYCFHRLPQPLLIAAVFVTFCTGVLIQYLGNYHYFEGQSLDKYFNYHWFHRNMILFSFPFFAMGYLINKHSIHEKVSKGIAIAISLLGIILLIGESYFNFNQEGRDGGFDNYASLLLLCPAIFLLFMHFHITGRSNQIALYSSSVFFIHSFFLSALRRTTELEATALTIITIVLSVFASYFVIQANKRLKVLL